MKEPVAIYRFQDAKEEEFWIRAFLVSCEAFTATKAAQEADIALAEYCTRRGIRK